MDRSSLRLAATSVAAVLSLAPVGVLATLVACGAPAASAHAPIPDAQPARDVATSAPREEPRPAAKPAAKAVGEACGAAGACAEGAACVFAPGCGEPRGTCQAVTPHCAGLPVAAQYCGCDGKTAWHGAAACPMTFPHASLGACPSP